MIETTETVPSIPIGSKTIPLSKGAFVTVDESDYEYLSQFRWFLMSVGYAVRHTPKRGLKNAPMMLMHREITGCEKGLVVDHINGDKLDNRRENLRVCTMHGNSANRHVLNKNNRSGFKGVFWSHQGNCWMAKITLNRKENHLGSFQHPEEAYGAYITAALEYHGEFAFIL